MRRAPRRVRWRWCGTPRDRPESRPRVSYSATPDAGVEPLPAAVLQRVDERHRLDQVRGELLDEQPAFLQRLGDQPEVEHLQVAQAAVDQLARAARRAGGEVAGLDQPDGQAAGRGVERGARARRRRRRRPGCRARRRARRRRQRVQRAFRGSRGTGRPISWTVSFPGDTRCRIRRTPRRAAPHTERRLAHPAGVMPLKHELFDIVELPRLGCGSMPGTIQSIERAAAILRLLGSAGRPLALAEVAAPLDLAAAHRARHPAHAARGRVRRPGPRHRPLHAGRRPAPARQGDGTATTCAPGR